MSDLAPDVLAGPTRPPAPPVFDNLYARLPDRFHAPHVPNKVPAPRLLRLNDALAARLGLDPAWLASPDGVAALAGNALPAGAAAIALAYAGHQFGHFTPALGDGRAMLLGEVVAPDGLRFDLVLKGAGRTAWSRGGDGRAALGPVLREYLVSEAMAALGVPTTRALAAIATGAPVYRETALPGAVLTRVAASHLRVGTFQYFAARGDVDALRLLADHAIDRHYPEARQAAHPVRTLLAGVVARQAALVAQWLLLGFVHGVMNTDNCAVSGETIDYGPCAFLDAYDPGQVFSSIDEGGRYAYGEQPRIAHWNVTRLAEALLPLLAPDGEEPGSEASIGVAQELLAGFAPAFDAAYLGGLRRKLGLELAEDGDRALAQGLLGLMAESRLDFTGSFRALAEAAGAEAAGAEAAGAEAAGAEAAGAEAAGADAVPPPLAAAPAAAEWLAAWRQRLARERRDPAARRQAMLATNPAYIPRNHLVEAALEAATLRDDLAPFDALMTALARPFETRPGLERYAMPGEDGAAYRTFCGT